MSVSKPSYLLLLSFFITRFKQTKSNIVYGTFSSETSFFFPKFISGIENVHFKLLKSYVFAFLKWV